MYIIYKYKHSKQKLRYFIYFWSNANKCLIPQLNVKTTFH